MDEEEVALFEADLSFLYVALQICIASLMNVIKIAMESDFLKKES